MCPLDPILGLFEPAASDIASRQERRIVRPALGARGFLAGMRLCCWEHDNRELLLCRRGVYSRTCWSVGLEALQQHQRQPQCEQPAHDDHGDEAHRAEGLALNVGDTEQEAPNATGPTLHLE